MKKLFTLLLTTSLLAFGAANLSAADTAPKSVIHVVTVAFKPDTTPAQIKAALDGVHKLPSQFKGITRVWTRAIKVQNPPGATTAKTHVIVMEFADEKALKDYSGSPAQLEWYKVYEGIRAQSTTYDITN
jgi:hypothetical protein